MSDRIEGTFDKIQEMCRFYQSCDLGDGNGKTDLCHYSKDSSIKNINECDIFYCPFVNLMQDDLK